MMKTLEVWKSAHIAAIQRSKHRIGVAERALVVGLHVGCVATSMGVVRGRWATVRMGIEELANSDYVGDSPDEVLIKIGLESPSWVVHQLIQHLKKETMLDVRMAFGGAGDMP